MYVPAVIQYMIIQYIINSLYLILCCVMFTELQTYEEYVFLAVCISGNHLFCSSQLYIPILVINLRMYYEWLIFQKIIACTLNLQTKNLRKQNHSQHVPMNLVKFANQTLIETTIYNLHISCSWWWRRRTQSNVSWGTEFKHDFSNKYAR